MSNFYFDAEMLIKLVEARPMLWNRSEMEFNKKPAKALAWREICFELCPEFKGLDDDEKDLYEKIIQTKWANIRDTWRKRLTNPGKRSKPYLYAKQLQFLLQTLPPNLMRKTRESRDEDETVLSRLIGIKRKCNPSSSTFIPSKSPAEKSENQPSPSESLHDSEEDCPMYYEADDRKDLVFRTESQYETEEKIIQEESHHILFFKSLLPSLATLNPEQTLEFQGGVIKLLQDIKKSAVNKTSQD